MTTQKSEHFTPENTDEFLRDSYYSNRQSREDTLTVCRKYNIGDKSQAIRLALRFLAQNEMARVPPPEPVAPRRGRPPATRT